MKLRTRLILAFLLLAVVPLTGLTLYSFRNSLAAYTKLVTDESAMVAREMASRMETVCGDLGRRMSRLERIPFHRLVSTGTPGAEGSPEEIYANILGEVGPSSDYVTAFEFEPAVPSIEGLPNQTSEAPSTSPRRPDAVSREAEVRVRIPPPPRPASPPPDPSGALIAPSPPEAVVIYLPPLEEIVRMAEEEGRASEQQLKALEEQLRIEFRQHGREAAEAQRVHIEVKSAMAALKKQMDGREMAFRLNMGPAGKEIRWKAEAGNGSPRAGTPGLKQDPTPLESAHELVLGPKLSYPVYDSDRKTGMLRARLDANRVLNQVMALDRPDDVAFALDCAGNLFTGAPSDRAILERLDLHPSRDSDAAGVTVRQVGDWIVVTKPEPISGVTFGIARPIGESIRELRRAALLNLFFGLGLVGLALLGIIPLSNRITRNLDVLSRGADELAEGNLDARVPVNSRDEFGRLALTFNRMAEELSHHQGRLVEQQRLEKELEMCRHIQREMLPQAPLRLSFAEMKGVSIPAREVGGDFFNYFPLTEDSVAILIGDVSGKGIAAALLMANLQASLKARLPLETNLAKLASQLDEELARQTAPQTFLTLFVGILNSQDGILRWVNAGHNTQFALRSDGGIERLDSTGRPLGLLPGGGYSEKSIRLKPGDSLFLYTDGLVEAENEADEPFGAERLEAILGEERLNDLESIMTKVDDKVREFRSGKEANDDATMLVLRIGAEPPTHL